MSAWGQTNNSKLEATLLQKNQELLDSIANTDYETYDRLCADDLSCMEPESNQNVVVGKAFHRYYFDVYGGNKDPKPNPTTATNVTMVQPHVRFLNGGTAAILSYVKLVQQKAVTIQQSETRVWECRNGGWVNVHFHKSPPVQQR